MATIPLGNFGQAIARPGPVPTFSSTKPLQDAAMRTDQIAMGAATDMVAQETQRQDASQRASAALALAKAQNDLHDAHDQVARSVMDGSIPSDKAGAEFSKVAAKVRDTTFNGYQPDQRMQMDAHLTGVQGSLDRSLGAVVVKRQQQETASTIDQFGEQVSREAARVGPAWAAQKFGSMVDFTGSAAGLTVAQQGKLKQQFSERVHATFYETAATGALTKGDAAALGDMVAKLQGDEGNALDQQKRTQLVRQIFGWQQSVLAKQATAANTEEDAMRVRTNAATDLYNKGTDVALGGGYFSPEFIKELTTAASGTPMDRTVVDLIASQQSVAGFASRSAPERASIIERMRAERATPGVGTDPLGDRLLQAVTKMDDKMRTAADENPWAAAQQAGRIQDAQTISASDPQSAVAIVRSRMAMIGQVETWAGKKVSPLQPQEIEQVGKMVRSLPVDQAATMLVGFGAALGDSERVGAMAKQLHDKDGSLGLAMMYASAQTTQGRTVAELVLRGDQALKDKAVLMDSAKATGWQATIAARINGLYANTEAQEAAKQAAFLILAARSADLTQGGVSIENAVTLATGGIVERNGQKFPLPYGMKEDQFDKALTAIKPADLAAQAPDGQVMVGRTPMTLDAFVATLPKASLVDAGAGRYNVRAGTATVTNSAGKRITLKVGP